MRLGLRWKILFITVLPLAILVFAALSTVNQATTRQVDANVKADLRRASHVLESVLDETATSQAVTGKVIVQDPRFFSVLTIPGSSSDRQLRTTIVNTAAEFNALTHADVFEVTDARGHLMASVGRDKCGASGRESLVRSALSGRQATRVIAQDNVHHLVCVSPVVAGGRMVGTLLLGTRIGGELANRMKELTRSEVTFVAGDAITGSTLEEPGDGEALIQALPGILRQMGTTADSNLVQVMGAQHQYITLVDTLPRAEPGTAQVYVMQRALDTETAFLRVIQSRLVRLGIIAMLAALIIGLLIAQRITAPVQRMVRGAQEMEGGNFEYPLDVRSNDEIGTLASSFDAMRRRQRDYIRTLKEASQAKSDFVDVASHELKTPLSIIRAYQETMRDGALGPLSPEQLRAVNVTLESAVTLEEITADLTRATELGREALSVHRGEYNVEAWIRKAIAAAHVAAPNRKVGITYEIDPGLVTASFDRDLLLEALVNLVKNGIRFTPDGGTVNVRARAGGAHLLIEVCDTGIGIETDRLTDLLDRPFAMRDARHHHSSRALEFNSRGFGLGLSIVRGIVEAHGGALAVASMPGQGSTFTMRLPGAPEREQPNSRAA